MNRQIFFNTRRLRLTSFAAVAVLHVTLLLFLAFSFETVINPPGPVARVMKLVDLSEHIPLEHIPPPPVRLPEEPVTNTPEAIAETMIETDEVPLPVTVPSQSVTEQIEYLPQHRLSKIPFLPVEQIIGNTVYPPLAQRSNIEGTVYLELFIDRQGYIQDIRILRETPPNRGFGEAAINAFKGIHAIPAESNGVQVASRYRYSISFTLK